MIKTKRQHTVGVTLLEVLLILAVAGSIIILSLKQYENLRFDQDTQRIQYDVDSIFQGLAGYYKANCYGQTVTSNPTPLTQGNLYVDDKVTPPNPFPIDIQTDLINTGYIVNNLVTAIAVNGKSKKGTMGYIAQFNEYEQTRNICQTNRGSNPAFGSTSAQNCKSAAQIGTVIFWKAQVSVELVDDATAPQYLALLNGDCLSSESNGTVLPCSASTGTGKYVVFERMPSFATQHSVPEAYESNPEVDQFTQMYTTYPAGYLINSGGQTPGQNNTHTEYFYCGG